MKLSMSLPLPFFRDPTLGRGKKELFFLYTAKENNEIEINFKNKKQLIVIMIKLKIILDTKNIFDFYINFYYF